MRGLALVLAAGPIVYGGCSGDSSALMSVWNDDAGVVRTGGAVASGGAAGGYGGQPFVMGGSGGAIGAGGSVSSGVVDVPGGTRDLATNLCTITSGGTCPVSGDYIACLKSDCATNLSQCYYLDGHAKVVGGDCRDYANCMLGCSCGDERSACEESCVQSFAYANSVCSNCFSNLWLCSISHDCPQRTLCPTSVDGFGGSMGQAGAAGSGGAAGVGGSTSVLPPVPVDAGPRVNLDAGPTYPRDARGPEVYVGPPADGSSFWFPDVASVDGRLIMPPDVRVQRPEVSLLLP